MVVVRALLAGGGSAGHTSPLIATADAVRRLAPDAEIVCLGTARGLETRVIPGAGYRLELIPPVPLPRRPGVDLLRVPSRLRAAVRATREVLRRVDPDVVVGFGGYVSMPAYVAARRMHVPVVVHEGNAMPGLANRFGARFCTHHVATSFPDTPLPHASFTGLPIRRSISTLDRAALRPSACAHFGLDPSLPTLLVTGGSQGAAHINAVMADAAPALARAGVQVLHVMGPKGFVALPTDRGPDPPPYVVVPFVDRMELGYAVADATVGRAGANSVTEAAVLGLPAVFVPLPIGNGEQRLNARAVVGVGAAILVENKDFTAAWVAETLPALMTDPARLAQMGQAARGLMRSDADEAVARMILAAVRP
jgi:UDP-N-acetylglucosamine--N-acetylmuramyl-(pentapeptide) pyrophosphoryl-undecaprenol N-acetylglucosamine transferase